MISENIYDIVVYSPPFDSRSGGVVVLYSLAEKLQEYGLVVGIACTLGDFTAYGSFQTAATKENIGENTTVVYPEIIAGNPLNAARVVRWILCEVGRHTSPNIVATWGPKDLVLHFSTFNPCASWSTVMFLTVIKVDRRFIEAGKTARNVERKGSCIIMRKARLFHGDDLTEIHPDDAVLLEDEASPEELLVAFTKYKFLYCYDPYSFHMVHAAMAGCLPVVIPIKGVKKEDWIKSLYAGPYFSKNKIFELSGIAWGVDDMQRALESLPHVAEQQDDIVLAAENSIREFADIIKSWTRNRLVPESVPTVESTYDFIWWSPVVQKTLDGMEKNYAMQNETIAELERSVVSRDSQIVDRDSQIVDRDNLITDLNRNICNLDQKIESLDAIVESAKRWQRRSWFKRAFHKWRPVTPKIRISQLRKLERSFRKRRDKVLASPSSSKAPESDGPPQLRSKDDIRREARKDLLQFLGSGEKIEFSPVTVGSTPRVSVIVVLYNQAGLTLECFRSLRKNQNVSLEVIVVDNASTDETHLLMERVTGVTYVRNDDNLHFLKSVNQAADFATAEFILLLNNDAMPSPDAIAAAVRRMEGSPHIGAVGGKIVLYDGTLQEAGSIIWADGSCLGYGRGDSPDDANYQFVRSVDYCSGAFLLTRRNLFEQLGRLDTQYCPAYYEETDYCVSLIKAGYEIVYDPSINIRHFEFASSTTDQSALDLQSRNQRIFADKNNQFLTSQQRASGRSVDVLFARQRLKKGCKRILIIEDRVPYVSLGSGYPRANAIVRILFEQGHAITLYPLQFPKDDWQKVYQSLPDGVEVMLDRGKAGLADFLRTRSGYYDIIFVSRPHNMEVLRNILAREPGLLGGMGIPRALLVYDAEALYALRDDVKAIVSGKPNPAELSAANIEAELALVGYADTVIAVSELEANYFRRSNRSRVVVLGHSVDVRASMNEFGQRFRFLFVGALHSDDSPNADSMRWFTDKIWPLIRARFDFNVELDIVGPCNAMSIRGLNGKNGVTVHGMVDSLDTFYDQARVFVVPTRFAAGIPLKAYEAASRGIPMVTTHLIASQLGWQGTVCSADDPCEFAQLCIDLFIDEAKWVRNREGILSVVSKDCGIESFTKALFDAIGT